MSKTNEDKTYGDFREMGLRLAQEVISFLKRKMDKASRSGKLKDVKLSFVGHSIGNLILRTALAGIYTQNFEGMKDGTHQTILGKVMCLFLLFQKASWSHI